MDLKEKIKALPGSPGVYIMKGADRQVLYVGKAGNLKKRVSSYFYPNRRLGERIEMLVGKVKDISYLPTATEAEALIYENGLIKKLSPKYNVALKDGKSYPLLKLTVNEKFPRLFTTRDRKNDGAVYYGPYSDARLLRQAVIILRQVFPLRTCGRMPKSTCLDYHIRQCLGPCVGEIDEACYGQIVSELKLFLEGRKDELVHMLAARMREESSKENFEEASRLKSRIEALGSIRDKAVKYGAGNEIEELRNILGMKSSLDVIEAFDVSNIMGSGAVGSMIYFYKGKPKKSEYRKFRIKTVAGVDDYAMMREIVRRRYTRLIAERVRLPNLVLIDGGKGHLSAALEELEKLGLTKLPVIGIAKEFEHIFLKGRKDTIVLPKESKALHLLERVRDEAHRFAISYHKRLRSKKMYE
jgi:excinuclease ABC subunit C